MTQVVVKNKYALRSQGIKYLDSLHESMLKY
jgi:hypothetical protein